MASVLLAQVKSIDSMSRAATVVRAFKVLRRTLKRSNKMASRAPAPCRRFGWRIGLKFRDPFHPTGMTTPMSTGRQHRAIGASAIVNGESALKPRLALVATCRKHRASRRPGAGAARHVDDAFHGQEKVQAPVRPG